MSTDAIIQWAHQGGAREVPSNTLMAMKLALDSQEPDLGLETDVHITRDGQLVICHDRTVSRTTQGFGRIRGHTYDALRTLNAAWWWTDGEVVDRRPGASHPGRSPAWAKDCYIPLLEDVLDLRHRDMPTCPMTIEVKHGRAARPLLELLERKSKLGEIDDSTITITSFFDWTVWRIHRYLQQDITLRVGLAPGMFSMLWFWVKATLGIPSMRSAYSRLQIPTRKLGITFTTPRLVQAAHAVKVRKRRRLHDGQTMKVDVWTIDDPGEMAALIELGVDGIMTDRPSVLRRVVARRRS